MDHHLRLYAGIRSRVRWILGLLAALSLASLFAVFARLDRMHQESDLRNTFLRSDARANYAAAARSAFVEGRRRAAVPDSFPGTELVAVESVPDLHWDISLKARAGMPAESFRFGGQQVSLTVFALMIIVLPTVLLLLLITTFRQVAQLHRMLAPSAVPLSETQQRLNALYFDRVTERYREGWRRHVWAGGVIVLVLSLAPVFLLSARASMRLDTRVAVDVAGMVYPSTVGPGVTPVVYDLSNTAALGMMVLMLANILAWAVLMWFALARIPSAVVPGQAAAGDKAEAVPAEPAGSQR